MNELKLAGKDIIKSIMIAIVLLGFIFLLNLGFSSAVDLECYQMTANVSTECGGLSTGTFGYNGTWHPTYGVNRLFDLSQLTGSAPALGNTTSFFVNYSKPLTAIGTKWGTYYHNSTNPVRQNMTITSDCFSMSKIELMIVLKDRPVTQSNSTYYCKNSSGWKELFYDINPYIYEEYIFWTINGTIKLYFNDSTNTSKGLNPSCDTPNGSMDLNNIYTSLNTENTKSITCSLTNYQTTTISFQISNGSQTLYMTPNSLKLNFVNYTTSYINNTGYYTDGINTQSFTNKTNISISLLESDSSKINIYFGYNRAMMNFTQFYDFDKTNIVNTEKNITIITGNNINPVYIRISDDNGNPISDALVSLSMSNPLYGGVYKDIGQRYTEQEGLQGITYFYVPTDSDIIIRVTREGYDSYILSRNILTNEYNINNPIKIVLKRGTNPVYKGTIISIMNTITNETSYIPLSIYAPSKSTIYFNTSDNPTLYSIILNNFDNGVYNSPYGLIKGIHYNGSKDFNVSFYSDAYGTNYIRDTNTKYIGIDINRNNQPTGVNNNVYFKLIWILAIISVGILGFVFKRSDESEGSGSSGKALFLIACFLIPLIFNANFIMLLIISVFYGALVIANKYIIQ